MLCFFGVVVELILWGSDTVIVSNFFLMLCFFGVVVEGK